MKERGRERSEREREVKERERKVGRKERKKKRRQKKEKEKEKEKQREKEREGGRERGWKKRKEKQKEQQPKKESNLPFGIHHEGGETASLWSPYGFSVFLMSFLSPSAALAFCRKIQSPQQKRHIQQSLLQETFTGAMRQTAHHPPAICHRDTRPQCGNASQACIAEPPAPKPASLGRINSSLPRKN